MVRPASFRALLERPLRARAALGVVAVLAVVAGAVTALAATQAARTSSIGYVDLDRVAEEYLRPVLDEPLRNETARLQADLDEKVKGLDKELEEKLKRASETERRQLEQEYGRRKQELFGQYQRMLDQRKQEMVNARLPEVREAIARVAEELGLDVVTDKAFVIWGGQDITPLVLARLGVRTQAKP